MTKAEVEAHVSAALRLLGERDANLLELNGHEVAVTHRLAVYMEPLFPGLDIDLDYNRHGSEPKRLDDALARPDIVVHSRGSDSDNLLFVEIKLATNEEGQDKDEAKARAALGPPLSYQFAALIRIGVSSSDLRVIERE